MIRIGIDPYIRSPIVLSIALVAATVALAFLYSRMQREKLGRRWLFVVAGLSAVEVAVVFVRADTGFVVSWHGFFTFVGVSVAVILVAGWARGGGIDADIVYDVAVWAVLGGIVGARTVHVIDNWDYYGQNLWQILSVWRGGIGLWGAILGGFVAGAAYVRGRQWLGLVYSGQAAPWLRKAVGERIGQGFLKGQMYARYKDFSVGRLADLTAPAMLITQTIGRVGDIINGEHLAKRTDLLWGFIYSHPDSPSNMQWGLKPSHPVIAYEMMWNMVALAVIWRLRGRLAPPGMLWVVYLMLYALGRFFIQFLRLDKVWFGGFQEAHLVALVVLAVVVPILAYKARWVRQAAAHDTRPRGSP